MLVCRSERTLDVYVEIERARRDGEEDHRDHELEHHRRRIRRRDADGS